MKHIGKGRKKDTSHQALNVNKIIGTKVKRLRKFHKWTQTELGKKINLSQGELSNIESGNRPITADKLVSLSKVLKRDVIYFLSDFVNK